MLNTETSGSMGNLLEVLIFKSCPSLMTIQLFIRFAIEANIPNEKHEHIGPRTVEAMLTCLVMRLSLSVVPCGKTRSISYV